MANITIPVNNKTGGIVWEHQGNLPDWHNIIISDFG